jgi:hypothetical protein
LIRDHKKCPHYCGGTPDLDDDCFSGDPCDVVSSDGDTYTVALTDGPFQFATTVVLNSKGSLNSTGGFLNIIAPVDDPAVEFDAEYYWEDVYHNCARDFNLHTDSDPTEVLVVGPNDWGIGTNSDSNIHIDLSDIILEQGENRKEIQIHLRGNPLGKFLPACGDNPNTGETWVEWEDFALDYYTIWGKPWSGHGRSWDTCNHFDGIDLLSVIPEGTSPFPTSMLRISITCSP